MALNNSIQELADRVLSRTDAQKLTDQEKLDKIRELIRDLRPAFLTGADLGENGTITLREVFSQPITVQEIIDDTKRHLEFMHEFQLRILENLSASIPVAA